MDSPRCSQPITWQPVREEEGLGFTYMEPLCRIFRHYSDAGLLRGHDAAVLPGKCSIKRKVKKGSQSWETSPADSAFRAKDQIQNTTHQKNLNIHWHQCFRWAVRAGPLNLSAPKHKKTQEDTTPRMNLTVLKVMKLTISCKDYKSPWQQTTAWASHHHMMSAGLDWGKMPGGSPRPVKKKDVQQLEWWLQGHLIQQ